MTGPLTPPRAAVVAALDEVLRRPGAVLAAAVVLDVGVDPTAPGDEGVRVALTWPTPADLFAVHLPHPGAPPCEPPGGWAPPLEDWAREVARWLAGELEAGHLGGARRPRPVGRDGRPVQVRVAELTTSASTGTPGPRRAAPPPAGTELSVTKEALDARWLGALSGTVEAGEASRWAQMLLAFGDDSRSMPLHHGLTALAGLDADLAAGPRTRALARAWRGRRSWEEQHAAYVADPIAWNREHFTSSLQHLRARLSPHRVRAHAQDLVEEGVLTAADVEAALTDAAPGSGPGGT